MSLLARRRPPATPTLAALMTRVGAGAVLFGVGGRGNSGMRSTGAMMVGGSVFAAILLGVVIPIFNQFT